MRLGRHAFAFIILSVLLLSPGDAEAQTAVSYRFLEVVDAAGKPVADARIESLDSRGGPLNTDANGAAKNFPVYYGDFNTRGLRVLKPGYITHEETGLYVDSRHWKLLEGEVAGYDPNKIKVVLLKEPATDAERRAVEVEQRKRELLLAVKRNDVAAAEKLLRAGVSVEAADVHGIPAILWAAAGGDLKMIKALLAAGVEVRNKSRPGRKALLYYLDSLANKYAVDVELVQTLVKAGADVNAASKDGKTVLSLAGQTENAQVIKLLERAGARRK